MRTIGTALLTVGWVFIAVALARLVWTWRLPEGILFAGLKFVFVGLLLRWVDANWSDK